MLGNRIPDETDKTEEIEHGPAFPKFKNTKTEDDTENANFENDILQATENQNLDLPNTLNEIHTESDVEYYVSENRVHTRGDQDKQSEIFIQDFDPKVNVSEKSIKTESVLVKHCKMLYKATELRFEDLENNLNTKGSLDKGTGIFDDVNSSNDKLNNSSDDAEIHNRFRSLKTIFNEVSD